MSFDVENTVDAADNESLLTLLDDYFVVPHGICLQAFTSRNLLALLAQVESGFEHLTFPFTVVNL